ncbi:hypothetical protein M011DRAFT_96872 [Sporormia fimetaria CBS 119925]|uniref:Uncharacterized protein n=1 Tax=Sporormia fimetaria CBS 119925 TaxID=1340428 RepID=A0A6A6V847_9PLEO|nr:hypothetical protein M011DRAFT_96872 [Sporormia fimetaria CBS 119925]
MALLLRSSAQSSFLVFSPFLSGISGVQSKLFLAGSERLYLLPLRFLRKASLKCKGNTLLHSYASSYRCHLTQEVKSNGSGFVNMMVYLFILHAHFGSILFDGRSLEWECFDMSSCLAASRTQFVGSQRLPRKRNRSSTILSYLLPFLPSLLAFPPPEISLHRTFPKHRPHAISHLPFPS